MQQDLIFQPMGALAALTFFVLVLIPIRRFAAGFAGKITADDFKYGESANVPGSVSIPNRAYMNLLEMPVLFYVICLILFVSGRVDALFLNIAWIYVVLRALHTLVHITYNNVRHRLVFFALSNFTAIAMWALFFWPTVQKLN
ncbi:MAG: MAPEG family protein [Proteobacteria bacterium]|nr:MAPEG family protein [Pseudomonadota bacterium]